MPIKYKGTLKYISAGKDRAIVNETIVTGSTVVGATSGYVDIEITSTGITTDTSIGVADADYTLDIEVDGVVAADKTISIDAGATYGDLLTTLRAIPGVGAAIVGGQLRIGSLTKGASSSIVVADGTTNGLLAAIDAITPETSVIGTPVAGTPGALTDTLDTHSHVVMIRGDFSGRTVGSTITYTYADPEDNKDNKWVTTV